MKDSLAAATQLCVIRLSRWLYPSAALGIERLTIVRSDSKPTRRSDVTKMVGNQMCSQNCIVSPESVLNKVLD